MELLLYLWLIFDNRNIVFSTEPIAETSSDSRIEYRIENKSHEDYLTWVNFDCQNDDLDVNGQVRSYFKVPRTDFSLEGLLFDNVQFSDDFIPVLGKTFLKRVEPESAFSYFVDPKQGNPDTDIVKHIFVVSESKVREIIGAMPNIDKILFKDACAWFACANKGTVPDERPRIVQKVLAFNGGKYMPVDDYVGRVVDSLMNVYPTDSLVILHEYNPVFQTEGESYIVRTGKNIVCFEYEKLTHKISNMEAYRPKEYFNSGTITKGRDIIAELLNSFTLEKVVWKELDCSSHRCLTVNYIWFYKGRIRKLNASGGGIPEEYLDYMWI